MLLLTAQATVSVLSVHGYWAVKKGEQAKLLGEEGDILQARDEVQGWEGALLLFKAMGGSSHVAMRSFFCPDLPRFSDKRAQETSKCCWQSCSSSWEHALHREHLACRGLAQLPVDQRPSPGMSTSLNSDVHHGAQRESMHEAQALLPGLALSSRVLTMGGMAAALCFSCFRSSGFCGEELSLASLGVLSRLGRGDSSLEPNQNISLNGPWAPPHPAPLFCAAKRREHPLNYRGACWTAAHGSESGLKDNPHGTTYSNKTLVPGSRGS